MNCINNNNVVLLSGLDHIMHNPGTCCGAEGAVKWARGLSPPARMKCASSKSSRSEGEILKACEPNGKQSPGGGGVKSSSSGLLGGTRVPCLASRM